jgi:hypothetical protein
MIPPLIHAVMVLYKRAPEESETFTSLQVILQKRSDLAAAMSLLVYDNSPAAQEMPALPFNICILARSLRESMSKPETVQSKYMNGE